MHHSLRAVSLSWLILLVPILAGSPAGADGNRARNKAPIAKNDAVTTAVDTSVTIHVTANDRDRDGHIARKTVLIIGAGPLNGKADKRRNGTVVYTPNPGFSGQDTFRYRVKDNRGALSKKARVQVTILPGVGPDASPVADAGPDRNAVTGLPVILNGSASFDPDGNTLVYSWRFLSVPSASASADIVNPASPAPSFTPVVDGDYQLELTVTDGTLSDTDGVVITAAAPGHVPPNADAGTDIVVQLTSPAQTVTLNGSASDDPDDLPNPTLTFQWTFVSTPTGSALTDANITNATSAQASFTPDVLGVYLLQLGVFDGEDTDFDQVMVTVQPPTTPPPPVITSITSDNTPTLSGTAATGIIEVTLYQNNTPVPVPPAVSLMNGTWSYTYTTAVLPEGPHTFTAIGKNAAGQESLSSAAMNVTVSTGPTAPSINPEQGCNVTAALTSPPTFMGLLPPLESIEEDDPGPSCLVLGPSDGRTPARAIVQQDKNGAKSGPIHIYEVSVVGKCRLPGNDESPTVTIAPCLRVNIKDGLRPGKYHLKFFVTDVAGNESCVESKVIPAEKTGCGPNNLSELDQSSPIYLEVAPPETEIAARISGSLHGLSRRRERQ